MQIVYSCFRAFASARDEISLRKWFGGTAHLPTFEGELVAKSCFLGGNAFLHVV